jgi:hypothetical protein
MYQEFCSRQSSESSWYGSSIRLIVAYFGCIADRLTQSVAERLAWRTIPALLRSSKGTHRAPWQ